MKLRRILATAVAAAAMTAPVAVLAAAPAVAATDVRQEAKPTVEELRLAVTKAQAAYDAAVLNDAEVQKRVLAALKSLYRGGDHPLAVASDAADKAAKAAAAAKTEADAKLDKARADQDALPDDATPEQEDAAQKAVDDAQKAVDEAVAAKTEADAEAARADDERVDAMVAAAREAGVARSAREDALKALDAAKKALDDAEKATGGKECARDDVLAVALTGPKSIKAGGSGVFTYRVTNTGERTLDKVTSSAFAFGWEKIEQDWRHVHLAWSSADSPKWQTGGKGYANLSAALKPGGSVDFKLKVSVDADSKSTKGELVVDPTRYTDATGGCGLSKDGGYRQFTITHKPGKPNPGESSGGSTTGGGTGGSTGGTGGSTGSATGGATGSATGGGLATTGSSDATMPIALAGGAAVVLGAGAMVLVRRRKAGADA
ncbi:LPXTG cell wall anchor domain-containing protein [Streptomyces sp. NPDC093111]|uniref:LPXTG cell wall anchor domain-containing protein n=1 Tax=Streptomyces sp. NPDC093111 TaxID=3154978 RepID=UPI003429027C